MKKKLMFIVQSPGGVERYIKMLLKYLERTNFEIILVCSNDFKEKEYLNLVDVFINVDMCREINALKDFRAILEIRKIIKKYNPDSIYLHSSKAGAIGRVSNLGINNKVIYNPHGWAFCMKCSEMKKILYRVIEKVLASTTDKIIAISECEKDRAIKNKICSESKIEVLLNGIDISEYNENIRCTREELGIPTNAYVIGLVGRICDNKAPDIFIESAKKIKSKIENAFFVLVGDGPDRIHIESLIKKNNLEDCILITGWVKEPFKYINCFNQGMLLTRWEGFGLVLAEYMIAKVPIIATNVDSIPELVKHEFNGLLVEVDNIEETVNASLRLYRDERLVEKSIKNGYDTVLSKFNIEDNVKLHKRIFERM